MPKLKLDLVCQVAMVVKDLEKTVDNFCKLFDINESEFQWSNSLDQIRNGNLTPQIYNGVQKEYSYRQVNFSFGGMDMELFAPFEDSPGDPYADFLKEHGPGIHHLNIRLANRDEGIKYLTGELGITPLLECHSYGRHCAYFDLRKDLGFILEVASRVVGPRARMSVEELEALCR